MEHSALVPWLVAENGMLPSSIDIPTSSGLRDLAFLFDVYPSNQPRMHSTKNQSKSSGQLLRAGL
jgi:hypothetical protein